ncbi:MAG: hypothetical protein KC586_17785 [Myxococcales bacterium]|nr:hypothetical protein [Myxococcales bacterium]
MRRSRNVRRASPTHRHPTRASAYQRLLEDLGARLAAARADHPEAYEAELAEAIATREWPDPMPLEGIEALRAWAAIHPTLTFSMGFAPSGGEPWRELTESGLLTRVRALGFTKSPTPATALEHLAATPELRHVAQLTLTHLSMDEAGFAALAESPHLEGLVALQLVSVVTPVVGLKRLFSARGGQLTWLKVEHSGLDASVLEGFAAPSLVSLQLPRNPLGDDGARALTLATLSALTDLDLSSTQLGDAGLLALADSTVLDRVVELGLRRNTFGPAGVEALCASPHTRAVRRFHAGHTPLRDAGVAATVLSGWKLTHLDLHQCGLFGAASKLAQADFLPQLERPDVGGNTSFFQDTAGLRALLASSLPTVMKDGLRYEFESENGY